MRERDGLTQAFGLSLSRCTDGRAERLIRTVSDCSETGAVVLNEAFARGYVCVFFDELGTCSGTCFHDKKLLALNPQRFDAELAATLVHEARHAIQSAPELSADKNIRSLLVAQRAAEADATAFECVAAYEMREKVPEAWNRFRAVHPKIAATCSKTETPSLGEAFKAWYDDASYAALYDKDVVSFLRASENKAGGDFLRRDVPDGALMNRLCRFTGQSYLNDAAFLSSPRACCFDEATLAGCRGILRDAAFLYGRRDDSLNAVFVRSSDGSVGRFSCTGNGEELKTPQSAEAERRRMLDDDLRDVLPPWVRFKKAKGGR